MKQLLLLLLLLSPVAMGWWDTGHMVIFEIARLSQPTTTEWVEDVLKTDAEYFNYNWTISSATWPDHLNKYGFGELDDWHYKDDGWSPDGTPYPPAAIRNAEWALNNLNGTIRDTNKWVSAFSLRFFVHIFGDIHQPLHTISMYSKEFPNGDRGGNLFKVKYYGKEWDLHSWWDSAGDTYAKSFEYPLTQTDRIYIRELAEGLMKGQQGCDVLSIGDIIAESHQIAIDGVYMNGTLKMGEEMTEGYIYGTRYISDQQMYIAGCRLGYLLS